MVLLFTIVGLLLGTVIGYLRGFHAGVAFTIDRLRNVLDEQIARIDASIAADDLDGAG